MSNEQDLTPAEARAEIEAFMGDGWKFGAHASNTSYYAYAHSPDFAVRVDGLGPTFRAAVSALKQAWRDAVRPWCVRTLDVAEDAIVSWESGGGDCWAYQTEQGDPLEASDIVARVLKESDHD